MTVTRKPTYTLSALADRASWLPIVHDFFTRMWLVARGRMRGCSAIGDALALARPAERLLVLWVLVGCAGARRARLGNERRYVMFIPALIALAGAGLGRYAIGSCHRRSPRRRDAGALAARCAVSCCSSLYLVFGAPGPGWRSWTRFGLRCRRCAAALAAVR